MFLPEVLLQPRWSPGARVMLTTGCRALCVRLAGIRAEGLQKMGVAVLEAIAVPTVWFLDGLAWLGLDWIAFFLSPMRSD